MMKTFVFNNRVPYSGDPQPVHYEFVVDAESYEDAVRKLRREILENRSAWTLKLKTVTINFDVFGQGIEDLPVEINEE